MIGSRVRDIKEEDGPGLWIPGLGDNKPRAQSAARTRADVTGGSSPRTTRTNSPNPDAVRGRRRRPRTATDSSLMQACFSYTESEASSEVVEETIEATNVTGVEATPFFDDSTSTILIKAAGSVVNADKVEADVDILIVDGVVKEISQGVEAPVDAKIIDARDKIVYPGGIDTCVRFFGDENLADDFASGGKAAANGGTTLVVCEVAVGAEDKISQVVDDAKSSIGDCAVGVALCPKIAVWNETMEADMATLVTEQGITMFAASTDELTSDGDLSSFLSHCRSLGALTFIKAESNNAAIVRQNEKRLLAKGITGPEGFLMSRPDDLEEAAVLRAVALAKQAKAPVVIRGPTSKAALDIIERERKATGLIYGEANLASLAASGSEYFNGCWPHAAAFVVSPPLRDEPDAKDVIRQALNSDTLSLVASQHQTYDTETKMKLGKDNFGEIPTGTNGVEERVGLTLASVDGDIRKAALLSANAAKLMGLWPRKGSVTVGADADLVIWNPNNLAEISRKTQTSKSDFNVFEGRKIDGAPETVLIGGKVAVYEYRANENRSASSNFVECVAFAPEVYDKVAEFEEKSKGVKTEREGDDQVDNDVEDKIEEKFAGVRSASANVRGRSIARELNSAEPILNKRLGIYQRPMSAHGVRNQQDSTFSLVEVDAGGPRKSSVKVNAPPGGGGRGFW